MNEQCGPDAERAGHRHEDRGGGAILHDPDAGVNLGVQMIREVFDRGIHEFGRHYGSAREAGERPPQRFRTERDQNNQQQRECRGVYAHTHLGTQCAGQAGTSEPKSGRKRLVFRVRHV